MNFGTFFPTNLPSLFFVLALIAWFVMWLVRLRKEVAQLAFVSRSIDALDNCIDPLRKQQLWRDRQRLGGLDVPADPSQFFDEILHATFKTTGGALPPPVIQTHFKAVFVAGCDESLLEAHELITETLQDLAGPSDRLRTQILLMLGLGALGTLFALSHLSYGGYWSARALYGALPPLVWGLLLSLVSAVVFLRFRSSVQGPCFLQLRRKTTTVWIPKLYPTVAQRAAQWAVQTLQNAARVADASQAIDNSTRTFVTAISDAKQASEVFSNAMQQFSYGIQASDQALVRAQSSLGSEVQKFADSLRRWTSFEDEMRRFYSSVDAHQKQVVEEQKTIEYLLTTYRDIVRQATGVLEKAARDVATAAGALPLAFNASADRTVEAMAGLASNMQATHEQSLAELRSRLEQITAPVLAMEDRLRALGEPFKSAAHEITEVATNLWKLNETFTRELARKLPES